MKHYVVLMKWSLFQEKVMNIKCYVIVDAWLGQIVDTGFLFLELIGDSCTQQRVGSVHYRFKLPMQHYLEIFIVKENDEYIHSSKY